MRLSGFHDAHMTPRWLKGRHGRVASSIILALAAWAAAAGAGLPDVTAAMAGVAVLMGACWVLETVPIPVTSLFPLVFFPFFGIESLAATAANYGKPTIFLFLGGFLLALGIQRSGLHRRIALRIVRAIGSAPDRLVLGFMVASGLLSMWISNTAAVMVMMPIGLAVLEEARDHDLEEEEISVLGTALMLGIAYAGNIGGMATPVGTPPNLVFLELQGDLVGADSRLGFGEWMMLGLPFATAFLGLAWYMLTKRVFRLPAGPVFGESTAVADAHERLGAPSRDEILSGLVFGAAALLWVTGSDVRFGESWSLPGWRSLLGLEDFGDGAVAIAASLFLFLLPSKDHPDETLLDWETAKKLPWGLLLLFGGGFALAAGFKSSGLSEHIGGVFEALQGWPEGVLMVAVCLGLTFLTELTSNTATTTLVLPILARAASALGVDPLILMLPATLSASCAFMMPVASPTQAIVFGSGYVKIGDMVRAGIRLNLLGVGLMTLYFYLFGAPLLGLDFGPW